jgi:hypothetical protein
VSQEGLVEARHLGRGYEINSEIETAIAPRVLEQPLHDPPQQAQVHATTLLPVMQIEYPLATGARFMA